MIDRQSEILRVLRQRIASGKIAPGVRLPRDLDLAAEFSVNVKTVGKAMRKLAAEKKVLRKRRAGTVVLAPPTLPAPRQIEVIFEGEPVIFLHHYWGEIWSGLVETLRRHDCLVVLNMLRSDGATGLLKLDRFAMAPSVGKIILGIGEKRLIDQVVATGQKVVSGCDPLEDGVVPQVSFDFRKGIADAVGWLVCQKQCRRIAFIGETRSYLDNGLLHKYKAYCDAIQNFYQLTPSIIGHARPLVGHGRAALREMLEHATPDALIAAYDHQLPELLTLLAERQLTIPVVGCDGLSLPGIPAARHTVAAPRRLAGVRLAEKLLCAMDGEAIASERLPCEFCFTRPSQIIG